GDPQGAHRQRWVWRGELALLRARDARLGADLGADPRCLRRRGESQTRSERSTLTYMRCRALMSDTRTHSLTLWIEAFTTPSSTTCAPRGAMKRPSDVPPPVESLGRVPVTCATASATASESRPGAVWNGSPDTNHSSV